MLFGSSIVGAEVESGGGVGGDNIPTVGASPPLALRERRFEVRIPTFFRSGNLGSSIGERKLYWEVVLGVTISPPVSLREHRFEV